MADEPTQPQPQSQVVPQTSMADLTRDTTVNMVEPDGVLKQVTVGALVDAYRSRPDEKTVEQMGLFTKALKDQDPVAAKAFAESIGVTLPDSSLPGVTPVPATPAPATELTQTAQTTEDITSLRKELDEFRQQVTPTVDGITQATRLAQITQLISTSKDQYPSLGRVAQGAMLVKQRLDQYQAQLDVSPTPYKLSALPPDDQQKVMANALKETDQQLQMLGQQLGVSITTPTPTGPVVVNDQGVVQPVTGELQEGQVKLSAWQRNRDALQQQQQGQQQGQPLPSQPVTPIPTGLGVGMQPEAEQGPLTGASLRQRMKSRVQSIGGGT